jgi:poly-gamma-glutamate synthesis protein (capsule biosynthesis protein)
MHGGSEYLPYPPPGFAKKCRYFIDRGADAVICHHSHVAGAFETYRGKPIIYSLGNLLFGSHNPPEGWGAGYAARLEFAPDATLISREVLPYTQSVAQGGVEMMRGALKRDFLQKLDNYEKVLKNERLYKKEWDQFCDKVEQDVLSNVFSPVFFPGIKTLFKLSPVRKMLLPKKVLARRLVSLRCESHREVLLNIMERRNQARL